MTNSIWIPVYLCVRFIHPHSCGDEPTIVRDTPWFATAAECINYRNSHHLVLNGIEAICDRLDPPPPELDGRESKQTPEEALYSSKCFQNDSINHTFSPQKGFEKFCNAFMDENVKRFR